MTLINLVLLLGCLTPMFTVVGVAFVGHYKRLYEESRRELLWTKLTYSKQQLLDHYASTTAE